jgi:NAD(P)-dependent dehydrogenase (short-subunit alcohol dehydrogenase family)
MEFGNDVVMLTGAGGRLGQPCALAFAAEGARLLLTDVEAPTLEETARLARARGATVLAVPGDVTRRADVEAALALGRERLGPVDVLVNFAGYVPVSPVLDVSEEEWDRVFAVNVKGTMLCCQAVGREMVGRGAAGRIVNISSGASTSARAGAAHYCGSKAAINMFTEVLATELGPHGIRVNAVAPGLVWTPWCGRASRSRTPTSATCSRRPPSAAPACRKTSPRPCSSSRPRGAGGSPARCSS